MNIFYLDKNPMTCAEFHNDKHVVKMIVETAQLLCGAHWATGGAAPYSAINLNHPCCKWVRANKSNYNWLCTLGLFLSNEFTFRYDKHHKSSDVINWCCKHTPDIPDGEFFDPPLAMPDHCKISNNAIKSYRNYYMVEKKGFSTWKNRKIPSWFK